MKRYLILYFHFLRFSFIKAMHFRVDFFFRIIMDTMYYIATISFYYLIFKNLDFIQDWNFDQIMVFVSIFLLMDALEMSFFSTNFWWLPSRVNKGELDYYILRPVSSQFFLTLREFAANSFVNVIMVVVLLIYSMNRAFETLDVFTWLRVMSGLGLGLLLSYSLQVLVSLPSFWTQSSLSITFLFHALNEAREKPAFIYRSWFKFLFVAIFPVCVITFYPAKWVLEADLEHFLYLLFIALVFFILSRFMWLLAIKNYGSASS